MTARDKGQKKISVSLRKQASKLFKQQSATGTDAKGATLKKGDIVRWAWSGGIDAKVTEIQGTRAILTFRDKNGVVQEGKAFQHGLILLHRPIIKRPNVAPPKPRVRRVNKAA